MDTISRHIFFVLVLESFTLPCFGQLENIGMLSLLGGGSMGGTNSGMSAGLGMGVGGMSPMEYAMLDNSVKGIVGPHASPDMALISYATQHGPPRGFTQVIGYIPFFQNIARNVGLGSVPGDARNSTLVQDTDAVVMQRSIRWMRNNGLLISGGGALF